MGASNIGGPIAGTPSLGRLVGSIAVPTEIPQTIAIVARRRPTARECGLGTEEDATGGAQCRDITPALIIELI